MSGLMLTLWVSYELLWASPILSHLVLPSFRFPFLTTHLNTTSYTQRSPGSVFGVDSEVRELAITGVSVFEPRRCCQLLRQRCTHLQRLAIDWPGVDGDSVVEGEKRYQRPLCRFASRSSLSL